MKGRVYMLSQNLREHLAHGLLVAGRKVAHVANNKCLFECGQDGLAKEGLSSPAACQSITGKVAKSGAVCAWLVIAMMSKSGR